MKQRVVLFSVLAGVLGCSSADGSPNHSTDEQLPEGATEALGRPRGADGEAQCRGRTYVARKDKRSPQIPRDDVELIDTLIPHHQAALEMATMETERGTDPEVKAMAAKMKSDQAREIEELLQIRQELTGCTTVTPLPDRHMRGDMEQMMQLSGAALDLMFLENMIPHHAGAISFTHNALPNLMNPQLQEISRDVIDAQSMEIGEMHMMKERLEAANGDAGAPGASGVSTAAPAPCTSDADCGRGKCVARSGGGSFCDVPEMVVSP